MEDGSMLERRARTSAERNAGPAYVEAIVIKVLSSMRTFLSLVSNLPFALLHVPATRTGRCSQLFAVLLGGEQ